MIYFFKKNMNIVITLVIVIVLTGCSDILKYNNEFKSFSSGSENENLDNKSENNYNETSAVPDFSNLEDLRDFINKNHNNGILNMQFTYSGSDKLSSDILLKLITILQISYTYDNNSIYNLTLSDYIGNKIIRAYKSGDYSNLSDDESACLDLAIDVVTEAKNKTSSPFELELYIHDYITSNVDYSYKSAEVQDPNNPPRHLTAVGALIDKSANCQGYADAFYVLATIAGFNVGRLAVTSEGTGHMVNTINLDDKWFVLDATFNDTEDVSHPETCSYMSFNIGKDFCSNYEWEEISEYNKIADETDNHFYYYSDEDCIDFGYDKVFYNIDDLATEIVTKWNNQGLTDFHLALLGENDFSSFSDIIYDKLTKNNKSFSYSYTTTNNNYDTFIHFIFND